LEKRLGLYKEKKEMKLGQKYKIGDIVGISHSDHDDYFFDNPIGEIIKIDSPDEDGIQTITVLVKAEIPSNRIHNMWQDI
jgi:hypothetical protein